METPIKMDGLGVPLFLETPISQYVQILPFPSSWVLIFVPHPLVSMGISKSSPKWGGNLNEFTPPKTNMESQNGGLEGDFPFQKNLIFRFC